MLIPSDSSNKIFSCSLRRTQAEFSPVSGSPTSTRRGTMRDGWWSRPTKTSRSSDTKAGTLHWLRWNDLIIVIIINIIITNHGVSITSGYQCNHPQTPSHAHARTRTHTCTCSLSLSLILSHSPLKLPILFYNVWGRCLGPPLISGMSHLLWAAKGVAATWTKLTPNSLLMNELDARFFCQQTLFESLAPFFILSNIFLVEFIFASFHFFGAKLASKDGLALSGLNSDISVSSPCFRLFFAIRRLLMKKKIFFRLNEKVFNGHQICRPENLMRLRLQLDSTFGMVSGAYLLSRNDRSSTSSNGERKREWESERACVRA